jgi:hypothetical protein
MQPNLFPWSLGTSHVTESATFGLEASREGRTDYYAMLQLLASYRSSFVINYSKCETHVTSAASALQPPPPPPFVAEELFVRLVALLETARAAELVFASPDSPQAAQALAPICTWLAVCCCG